MLMTIVLSFIAVPVFASSGVRRVKKEPVGGGHVIAVQAQNDDQVFVRRAQKESASVVVSPQGRVDDDQGVRRHSTKQTQLDLEQAETRQNNAAWAAEAELEGLKSTIASSDWPVHGTDQYCIQGGSVRTTTIAFRVAT